MSKDKTKKTKEQVSEKEVLKEEEVKENEACEETVGEEKENIEEQLSNKICELEDKFLRLAAEYDNFKKRTQREKEALYTDITAKTVAEFLVVIDNMQRATTIEVEADEAKKVLDGVVMVQKQFYDILEKIGVTQIDTVGKTFDPNMHNAIMHIEDEAYGTNEVIEEFMKGYIYKDKVVRHSMVKVAN